MADEIEVICPECWAEGSVESTDDTIICQECNHEYYIEESVAD